MTGGSSMTLLMTFITLSESCILLGSIGQSSELSNSVECGEMVSCRYSESWDEP